MYKVFVVNMAGNTVKDMTTNFGKLDKFEGHDFRRWQKKMHFLLTTLKVVYVLTTPRPELLEDATVEEIRVRAKWENNAYICRGHILNGMSDSLFDVYTNVELAKELWDSLESKYMAEDSSSKKFLDFKHTLKHSKDDFSLVQLGSHLCIEESLRAQDSDKGKGKEVGGPYVNSPIRTTVVLVQTRNQSWNVGSVARLVTSKGIAIVVKRITQILVVRERGLRTNPKTKVDAITWWIDSGVTTHICKDRCWFKIYELVEDESLLYMGDDHFTPVHGKGSMTLEFSSRMTITLFNVLYVPKLHKNLVSGLMLNKCGYKQVYEFDNYILSKSGVFVGFGYYNNGHVHYKRMLEMSKDDLIPASDENLEKCTTCNKRYVITFIDDAFRFFYVYLLHVKDEVLDKFRIYKPEVELQQNDLIKTLHIDRGHEYYDPVFFQSVGIIHETIAPYTLKQNGMAERKKELLKKWIPNKRNKTTPYELWYKKRPNLSFLRVWGCRAVVRLPDPKRKTLGEKGIDCILVGYAEHSKAYWFYVIEPNDSISINSIIESRDLYLVEGSRDQVRSQYSCCYSIEEDPRTYNEAMQSRDAAFWKEAIDDETGFIMENNTWTAFLNGDLDEEVYIKQPEGFVMPGNEHKVCKLVKSLYGLKQAPKQWHQKFDEVVLSSGFHLNQSDKCVYSKFENSDMGEADTILGIKIKRENKGIVITQSHYIEKILKKFNRKDCSPVSTPMDPVEKLKPNIEKPIDKLEYSRAIGCLMYAMTSTRQDIAYAIGRLTRFTNASWINHVEDLSSTSGWVFLLGGGAISWASKKQTCITGLTMESKFVALAAAGKEA
nr:hypothetical protein [Tanacetum cinerariifolium]